MQNAVEIQRASRGWLRPLYLLAGIISLSVATVGLFLPLIPTTGPVLLAAFFFARSSQRLHGWLLTHRRFGRFIADFQAGRGIPRRAKATALVMMTAAFAYSIGWVVPGLIPRIAVAAVGIGAMWYVGSLPVSDRDSAHRS
jgi:uncharacterized membrane protein YbaN (DUF454 family)